LLMSLRNISSGRATVRVVSYAAPAVGGAEQLNAFRPPSTRPNWLPRS